jgi:hypothetical protein
VTEQKTISRGAKLTPVRLAAAYPEAGFLHSVEKPFRTPATWRKESEFHNHLQSLADLPGGLNKIDRIDRISEKSKIRAIWRRARLSRLENEFLALVDALISSPEKQWGSLVKAFLAAYGWTADLRGRPKGDPEALAAIRRGPKIEKIVTRLEAGFEFKLREKAKGGYKSDNEEIEAKLKDQGYDPNQIKAILGSRTLETAACNYYYASRQEPHLGNRKTIQNSYRRYQRMKAPISTK